MSSNKHDDFSQWIQMVLKPSTEGLIVSDIDYIFCDYKQRRIKMVEVKTFGKKEMPFAQKQIYKIIHEALKKGKLYDGFKYDGSYLICLSNSNPYNSEDITVNGKVVTVEYLESLLNFDI